MKVFEQWNLNEQEQAAILKALDRVWNLAWTRDELAPILRMRDALTVGCEMRVTHPYLMTACTPAAPFDGPAGVAMREKIAAVQAANLAVSRAATETGFYKDPETGEHWLIRIEHGGSDNGDVSILSGYFGPLSYTYVSNLMRDGIGDVPYGDNPLILEDFERRKMIRVDLTDPPSL